MSHDGSKKKSIFVATLLLFLVGLANAASIGILNSTTGEFLNQNWALFNQTAIEIANPDGNNMKLNHILTSLDGGATNFTIYNSSLILHYSFDSNIGNDSYIIDESGGGVTGAGVGSLLGFNGTVAYGNTSFTSTGWPFGEAMQFNGSQFISIPNFNLSTLTQNQLTFSFWIKSIDVPSTKGVLSQSSGGGFHVVYAGYPFNYLTWAPYIGGTQRFSSNRGYPWGDGQFHFIAFTFNGTNLYGYFDGQLNSSDGGFSGTLDSATSATFLIGSQLTNANFFNGSIDEIRFWNRSLSSDEIRAWYYDRIYTYLKVNASGHYTTISENFSNLSKGNYSHVLYTDAVLGGYVLKTPQSIFQIHPTILQCFDEENFLTRLTFNATVTNSTKTWYNYQKNYYVDVLQPENNENITYYLVDQDGVYFPRYVYLPASTPLNYSCVLLKISSGQFVRFRLLNSIDVGISGGLVTAFVNNGSNYVTAAQAFSDSTGTASLFLNPTIQYMITINTTSYNPVTFLLTPSANDYKIYLSEVQSIVYTALSGFENLSYAFVPFGNKLNRTSAVNISFFIRSTDSQLQYFGYIVDWNNTQITKLNYTSTNGGVAWYIINTTNYSGAFHIKVTGFFKKIGYNETNVSAYYGIGSIDLNPFSLENVLTAFSKHTNTNIPPIMGYISLILIAVSATTIAGMGSFVGGGVVALGMLSVSFFMGFLAWTVFLFTAAVVAAILYLRGRI